MTTSLVCHTHAIAPSRVIRGEQAWQRGLPAIADLFQRPALLGRSLATQAIRAGLKADLIANDLAVEEVQLNFDCCEEDLMRLEVSLKETGCDSVIAAGGGKVLVQESFWLIASTFLASQCHSVQEPAQVGQLSPISIRGWSLCLRRRTRRLPRSPDF